MLNSHSASVLHTNRLFDAKYGPRKDRRLPGHIPHILDREVLEDLNEAFQYVRYIVVNMVTKDPLLLKHLLCRN